MSHSSGSVTIDRPLLPAVGPPCKRNRFCIDNNLSKEGPPYIQVRHFLSATLYIFIPRTIG